MRNRYEWHNRLVWIQERVLQEKYGEDQVIIVFVKNCEIELISGQKMLLYLHWSVFLARSLLAFWHVRHSDSIPFMWKRGDSKSKSCHARGSKKWKFILVVGRKWMN